MTRLSWISGRRLGSVAALVAAALSALVLVASVHAEAPATPRPRESCTARLTLNRTVVAAEAQQAVSGTVTGLEPGAPFNVFYGTRLVQSGFADIDGSAVLTLAVDALVATAIEIQVASTSRCATATLLVAGPTRIVCVPVTVGRVTFCGPGG